MHGCLQVTTATPDRLTAEALARSSVERHLAASAHVLGPVPSVFWHRSELGEAEEWHVQLKTTADRYPDLESHLLQNHPWGNPEVTVVALAGGSADYLRWIADAVAVRTES